MYGWLRGIIFSKLALRPSLVAASAASSAVTSAQTIITARRWLNTARSSSEPPLASKPCSESSAAGSWAVAVCIASSISGPGHGGEAARAADHQRSGTGARDRGGRLRTFGLHRREGHAVVGADQHVPGLAGQHDAAALVERARG